MEGNAGEEELAELSDLAGQDASGITPEVLEGLAGPDLAYFSAKYDREKWMSVAGKILASDKLSTREQPLVPRTRILRRLRWAAAAAMLAAVALGGYWWLQPSGNQPIAGNREILPGSNKALLTLGDGSVIPLDSTGNQVIRQGKTAIYRQNGRLQYDAAAAGQEHVYNTLATPRGGQYQVMLPDGSKVWLNAASTLRYPTSFSDTARLVELTGEGYFEIQALARASKTRIPFRVKVGDMVVEVLGTHFNIMAYSDEQAARTTLLEGSVRVSQHNAGQTLRPGEQAIVTSSQNIHVIKEVDVSEVTAWKNGIFQFNRTGLRAAMRQLARWYDVEVVYESNVPDVEFYGKMQRELNLQEALRILEKSGVHFRVEGRKIIVTSN